MLRLLNPRRAAVAGVLGHGALGRRLQQQRCRHLRDPDARRLAHDRRTDDRVRPVRGCLLDRAGQRRRQPGSMAQDPVATAASNTPELSTLVTAVTKADLVDTLNTAQGITVFAPTNDAFGALPKPTLDKALGDPKGLLTTVLTYHVVQGQLAPDQLAGSHKTLQGGTLEVSGSGEDFKVNGNSSVVCGNIKTSNATVYLIDQVLLPKS